ncbi:MAG: hypothetical protein AAF487_12775 [Bacteroidota bacterium]
MIKNLALVFSIIALFLSLVSFFKGENQTEMKETNSVEEHNHEHGEIELAQYMGMLQTHFAKLYFAGQAENNALSEFYLHEMEESFETIVDGNVFEEGQNISVLAEQFGLNPVERLHDHIEANGFDDFEIQYKNMILNCNSCHMKTAHPFIQIKVPDHPPVGNQNYMP